MGSEPLGLAQLLELIVLASVGTKRGSWLEGQSRARLIKRLNNLHSELKQLKGGVHPSTTRRKTITPEGLGVGAGSKEAIEIPETSDFTSTHARKDATLLYELIARLWKCECRESHVALNLRLATRRKNHPKARFRLQISHNSTTVKRRQESDIEFITIPE